MPNKRLKMIGFALAAGLMVTACGNNVDAEGDNTPELRIATALDTSAPTVRCGTDVLAEELDGVFDVSVFPSSQMGTPSETANSAAAGDLEMVIAGPGEYSHLHAPLAVVDSGYLFDDYLELQSALETQAGEKLINDFQEASNLHTLGVWDYGTRHFTSNTPIRTPEDMAEITSRVPSTTGVGVDVITAMGPRTVPVDFGELYVALSQGVVNAQENPIPTIASAGFMEVQEYLNLTGHQAGTHIPVINNDFYQGLDEEQKDALHSAIDTAAVSVNECVTEEAESYIAEWEAEGIEVIDDVDREAFSKLVSDKLMESFDGETLELYEGFLAETQ